MKDPCDRHRLAWLATARIEHRLRWRVIASLAIVSPSMMMAFERANIDLLILALVGSAALVFSARKRSRIAAAVALTASAFVLKLHPVFCAALIARYSRSALVFTISLFAVSLAYFVAIFGYLPIIRRNTPGTSLLSYGYNVPFFGIDLLIDEAHLDRVNLAGSWIPIALAVLVLVFSASIAWRTAQQGNSACAVSEGVSGTAFLFGAGIYCGTFLLGSNFTYRLMFLLLCIPQLQDWQTSNAIEKTKTAAIANGVLVAVLLALWMNGNATFLFVPQLVDWVLFSGLTTIVLLNFLRSANPSGGRGRARNLARRAKK